MKVLLDEHYTAKLAEQLRKKGFDVVAVQEVPGLVGNDDRKLLAWCSEHKRALLTNDVGDFSAIAKLSQVTGERHYGLIFTSDQSMPRSSRTVGLYLRALTKLMRQHPAVNSLVDQIHWLSE